jgi:hypothetical protein
MGSPGMARTAPKQILRETIGTICVLRDVVNAVGSGDDALFAALESISAPLYH